MKFRFFCFNLRRSQVRLAGALLAFCGVSDHAQAQEALASQERQPASMRAAAALATPSQLFYNGETLISADLIDNYNKVRSEDQPIKTADYIPTNLHNSDNSSYVMSSIADKSISTVMNDAAFKNSPFGRTANSVQESMTQKVVIGGNSENSIQHKFDFQYQAFQSLAAVKYEGFAKANITYSGRDSVLSFEVLQDLAKNRQLVVSQQYRPEQRVSNVNYKWSF